MSDEQTEITIQDVYAALVNDQVRNDVIAADLIRAVQCGRSPLLLTGRTEHLGHFAEKLSGSVKNVFVLKGGLGRKQRREIAEQLAAVPENEQRVILATGSYMVRASMTRASTHCSSPCRSHGKEPSSSTWAAFIACTTTSGSSRCTTTLTERQDARTDVRASAQGLCGYGVPDLRLRPEATGIVAIAALAVMDGIVCRHGRLTCFAVVVLLAQGQLLTRRYSAPATD